MCLSIIIYVQLLRSNVEDKESIPSLIELLTADPYSSVGTNPSSNPNSDQSRSAQIRELLEDVSV